MIQQVHVIQRNMSAKCLHLFFMLFLEQLNVVVFLKSFFLFFWTLILHLFLLPGACSLSSDSCSDSLCPSPFSSSEV